MRCASTFCLWPRAKGTRQKLLRAEVKLHGHVQKQNPFEKIISVVLLLPTAIYHLFFSPLPDKSFCHALRARTCSIIFFSLRGYGRNTHTDKKCLHAAHGTLKFAGVGCAMAAFFFRAFTPPAFPRNPHAGRRGRGCLRTRRLTHE